MNLAIKIKKTILPITLVMASMSALVATSATAAQGEQVMASISVTSTVPSTTFTVKPVGYSDFGSINAVLAFDEDNNTFSSWNVNIEAVYATGLQVLLQNTATISNGTNVVDLDVTIDDQAVTTSRLQVVDDALAITNGGESTHILAISSASAEILSSGTYTGAVALIFEDNF